MVEGHSAAEVEASSIGHMGACEEPIAFEQPMGESCDHRLSTPDGLMPLDPSSSGHVGEGVGRGSELDHRSIEGDSLARTRELGPAFRLARQSLNGT